MPKKETKRQVRLVAQVTESEKKRAEKLARDEGFASVSDLVRKLLSERHQLRLKKAKAKKASPRPSSSRLAAKTGNPLALGNARLASKPSRSRGTSKRARKSAANGTSSKALKNRVVATGSSISNRSRRSTKASASSNG